MDFPSIRIISSFRFAIRRNVGLDESKIIESPGFEEIPARLHELLLN